MRLGGRAGSPSCGSGRRPPGWWSCAGCAGPPATRRVKPGEACPRPTRTSSRPTTGRSSTLATTSNPAARPWPRPLAGPSSSPPSGHKRYPAAVKCVVDDLPHLTVHLRFPVEHWRRIRHSNFERTFGETRRRVKVIGRLPGEATCVLLVWAVLDRASRGWRGFTMTPKGLRLLQDLRRQLLHPPSPPRRRHRRNCRSRRIRSPWSPRPDLIYTAPGTPPRWLRCLP